MLDVFAGARTPAHLTSVEMLAEVHRVLAPGGVLVANVADGPGAGVRARPGGDVPVGVPATSSRWPSRASGAAAGSATSCSLPPTGRCRCRRLTRRCAGDPVPARVVAGAELRPRRSGERPS